MNGRRYGDHVPRNDIHSVGIVTNQIHKAESSHGIHRVLCLASVVADQLRQPLTSQLNAWSQSARLSKLLHFPHVHNGDKRFSASLRSSSEAWFSSYAVATSPIRLINGKNLKCTATGTNPSATVCDTSSAASEARCHIRLLQQSPSKPEQLLGRPWYIPGSHTSYSFRSDSQ